eukprot:GHVS01039146.1.p1 GENE.GHVS01039146.1~~GHVS01039146.1.p1  ORF type:complete len:298 (-),score=43.82 GHVS01039146.1:184-1077(-)
MPDDLRVVGVVPSGGGLNNMKYCIICPQLLMLCLLWYLPDELPAVCLVAAGDSSYSKRTSSSRRGPASPPPPPSVQNRRRSFFSFILSFFNEKTIQRACVYTCVVAVVTLYFLFTWYRRRGPSGDSQGSSSTHENVLEGRSEGRGSSRRPTVSIGLNALVLEFDHSKHGACLIRFNESSLEAFRELCCIAELYVFVQVMSDEEEKLVHNVLTESGVVSGDMLQPHRIMYSSSIEGRASMVRQLQPTTHIDCEDTVIASLAGKVPNVVRLCRPADCQSESEQTLASFVRLLKEVGSVE